MCKKIIISIFLFSIFSVLNQLTATNIDYEKSQPSSVLEKANDKNFIFAYSDTIQNLIIPNAYQNIFFNQFQANGWNLHNSTIFKPHNAGHFLITYCAQANFPLNGNMIFRALKNGIEIIGSKGSLKTSKGNLLPITKCFIIKFSGNDELSFQFCGNFHFGRLNPKLGDNPSQHVPSFSVNIIKI